MPPGSGSSAASGSRARSSSRTHWPSTWRCAMAEVRLLALYPEQMNIYADRGNAVFLQRRCEWRGIGFTYAAAGAGERFDPEAHDLIYIRRGQGPHPRAGAAARIPD